MKPGFIYLSVILINIFFLYACKSVTEKHIADSSQKAIIIQDTISLAKAGHRQTELDSDAEFEKRIYFQIDKIYTGKVYNVDKDTSAFYRVLIIPQEENIMIIAENIAVLDDEGGNLKLRKLYRLTDDNSVLPKFGISNVDSIKFTDSVTIQGYFNNKKQIINLGRLKPYHPVFKR